MGVGRRAGVVRGRGGERGRLGRGDQVRRRGQLGVALLGGGAARLPGGQGTPVGGCGEGPLGRAGSPRRGRLGRGGLGRLGVRRPGQVAQLLGQPREAAVEVARALGEGLHRRAGALGLHRRAGARAQGVLLGRGADRLRAALGRLEHLAHLRARGLRRRRRGDGAAGSLRAQVAHERLDLLEVRADRFGVPAPTGGREVGPDDGQVTGHRARLP